MRQKQIQIRRDAHAVLVKVAVAQVSEAIQIAIALIRTVFGRRVDVIGAGPVDENETVVFRVGNVVPVDVRPANEATIGASWVVAVDIVATAVLIRRSAARLAGTVRWTGVAILAQSGLAHQVVVAERLTLKSSSAVLILAVCKGVAVIVQRVVTGQAGLLHESWQAAVQRAATGVFTRVADGVATAEWGGAPATHAVGRAVVAIFSHLADGVAIAGGGRRDRDLNRVCALLATAVADARRNQMQSIGQ
jgi:hypothetical protein